MPYQVTTVQPFETAEQFRGNFPEFSDAGIYPDASINYWMALATLLLNSSRFVDALQLAVEMYVAHNVMLEAQAVQTALKNGFPGETRGPISSESAGKVSINYDTASAIEEGAGHWNTTVYGMRLYRMFRIFGAGPIQVGPGGGCAAGFVPGAYNTTNAWSGPVCLPSPSGFGN